MELYCCAEFQLFDVNHLNML